MSIRHAVSNYIALQKFKNKTTTSSPSNNLVYSIDKHGEETPNDA